MLSISRYIELKPGDMRELGEREQQGDSNGQDWVHQIVHTSHWVKCDPRHTIWTLPNLAQDTRIQLYQASALLNLPEIQSHLEGEICLEGKSRALVATDNEKEFFISFALHNTMLFLICISLHSLLSLQSPSLFYLANPWWPPTKVPSTASLN